MFEIQDIHVASVVLWFLFFKSQNHRIDSQNNFLWKGPQDTTSEYSRPQADLYPVAEGLVQYRFGCLQSWRYHSLFGQPVPAFDHPHSDFFLLWILCWNFPFCSLYLLPLALLLCTSEKNLAPSPLYPPIKYWKTAVKFLLLFLRLSKQVHSASPCMSSATAPTCFGVHPLDLLQYISVFLVLDTVVRIWSHQY